MRTHLTLASLCLTLTAIVACGTLVGNPEEDGDDKDAPKAATSVAPVVFSLTDAPLDDAQQVLITVEGLEVSLEGEGWIQIPLSATTEIDLLHYQDGDALPLGQIAELEAGTYNQTRFRLSEAAPPKLVLADGTVHALEIPGVEKTGIKIVTPFVVEPGVPLDLTIDFDLRKSVKRIGGDKGKGKGKDDGNGTKDGEDPVRYQMKPVLRLVRNDGSGILAGSAVDGKVVCVYEVGVAKDPTDDCDNAINAGKVKKDRFRVAFLPVGDYEVRIWKKGDTFVDLPLATVTSGAVTELEAP